MGRHIQHPSNREWPWSRSCEHGIWFWEIDTERGRETPKTDPPMGSCSIGKMLKCPAAAMTEETKHKSVYFGPSSVTCHVSHAFLLHSTGERFRFRCPFYCPEFLFCVRHRTIVIGHVWQNQMMHGKRLKWNANMFHSSVVDSISFTLYWLVCLRDYCFVAFRFLLFLKFSRKPIETWRHSKAFTARFGRRKYIRGRCSWIVVQCKIVPEHCTLFKTRILHLQPPLNSCAIRLRRSRRRWSGVDIKL